ncbi:Zinc finger A20 and AN1 domain-containing stress-associated protein 8 [Capsicum baccatum]|uniref:Zinc finger A20 and AN1 domain-containing stress-associated protein 8 n=1 Tax=Capsicum baccatum TaxID=33114 RepID=A0A2G2XLZ0_CAPBA|nr:Zinc finger A20 and AN1 domain-containing stress-associated protein 8 [Capsicum baccatum]
MAITTRSGKVLKTSAKGKQVVDEVVRFDICETMKQPSDMNESSVADVHYEDMKALSIEKQPTVEPLSAAPLNVEHEDNEDYEELMEIESSKETGCQAPEDPVLCINDCDFFGSAATMNMYSNFQKDMILLKQEHEELAAASSKDIVCRSSSNDESELALAGAVVASADLAS